MARSSMNVPASHSEKARFVYTGTEVPKGERAVQVSFFAGYEAGKVTHYIACHFKNAEGRSSFWSKACNGRNKALWYDTNLQECREASDYEEVPLGELACKADWLKVA